MNIVHSYKQILRSHKKEKGNSADRYGKLSEKLSLKSQVQTKALQVAIYLKMGRPMDKSRKLTFLSMSFGTF